MAKVRVVLNRKAVGQLLKSKEMQAILDEQASRVLASLGGGYESEAGATEQRAKVRITAATAAARKENLENNTLLKAIGK